MTLTDAERLILFLLCDTRKKLNVDDNKDKAILDAMQSRNEWALGWRFDNVIFHSSTPANVELVAEILTMWGFIERSLSQLQQAGRNSVLRRNAAFGQFPGFDGNNESEYLAVARHFIDSMDLYSEFKGRNLNAHTPMMATYQKMLGSYNEVVVGSTRFNFLTEQQLEQILWI